MNPLNHMKRYGSTAIAMVALVASMLLTLSTIASAAPTNTFQVNLLPLLTDTYDLGSTTPTKEWNNLFVKNVTVSGTCSGCGGVGSGASTTLLKDVNTFSGATTTFLGDVWVGKNSAVQPNPYVLISTSSPGYGRFTGTLMDAGYSGNTPAIIAAFNPNRNTCAGSGFISAGDINVPSSDYTFIGFTNSNWTGSGCAVGNALERPESTIISNPTGDMNFELGSTSAAVAYRWYTNNTTLSMTLNNGTGQLALYQTGTSTFAGGVFASRIAAPYFIATSSSATSTFAGGLNVFAINETGNSTSTFKNGVDLSTGCFSVNGVCITGSTGSSGLTSDPYWVYQNAAISTTSPVLIAASTTIGGGATATGLTINGGATTTGFAFFNSPVGINGISNRGAFGGSGILTINGDASNGAVDEFFRPISSGQSNVFTMTFGDTSNSVLGQINGRTDTTGAKGQLIFRTSDGTNDRDRLTLGSAGTIGFSTSTPFAKFAISADTLDPYNQNLFLISSSSAGTGATSTLFVVTATGSTTIAGQLNLNTAATSSSGGGFNIATGCFAVAGVCVGGGSSSGGGGGDPFTHTVFGGGTFAVSATSTAIEDTSAIFVSSSTDPIYNMGGTSVVAGPTGGGGWPMVINNPNSNTGTTTGIGFSITATPGLVIGAAVGFQRMGASSFGDLFFATTPSGGNNTERMRITSTGTVGIGTTTIPFGQLTLNNATQPQLTLADSNAATFPWTLRGVAGNFYLATSTSAATSTIPIFSIVSGNTNFSALSTFKVNDRFNSNVMTITTASTSANIFEIDATSSGLYMFGIDQFGHIMASSTKATPTLGTCTGGATFGANANDDTGSVVLTTAVTSCAIIFANPYTTTPKAVQLTGSGTVSFPAVTALSTTGFTIGVGAAVSGDTIYYTVIQ